MPGIIPGIINGQVINNFSNADDTVIIAFSRKDLENMLNNIQKCSNEYGLKIIFHKKKYMIISKNPIQGEQIIIDSAPIERVTKYQYLRTKLN